MKPNLTAIYRNLRYRTILAGDYGARNLFQNGEEGVWYDPSDLTTMFQDAAGTTAAVVGQPVGKILDKSGNGNHATQSTDLSRPILRQSGDKYYLEFDGIDDFLVTSAIDFTGTDKISVFAGVMKDSDTAISSIVEHGIGGTDALVFNVHASNGGLPNYRLDMRAGGLVTTAVRSTYAAPITNLVTGLFDYAGTSLNTELIVRINGTVDSEANSNTGPLTSAGFGDYILYIGMRGGTDLPFNGSIYSLIIRGALSTSEEITNAERYVNSKTGAYND